MKLTTTMAFWGIRSAATTAPSFQRVEPVVLHEPSPRRVAIDRMMEAEHQEQRQRALRAIAIKDAQAKQAKKKQEEEERRQKLADEKRPPRRVRNIFTDESPLIKKATQAGTQAKENASPFPSDLPRAPEEDEEEKKSPSPRPADSDEEHSPAPEQEDHHPSHQQPDGDEGAAEKEKPEAS